MHFIRAPSMTVTTPSEGLAGSFPCPSLPLPSVHPSAQMLDPADILFSLFFPLHARCAAFSDGHLAGCGSGSGGDGRLVSPWRARRFGSATPSTHVGSTIFSRFTASERRADGIAFLAGPSRRGVIANVSTGGGGGDDRGAFGGARYACPVRSCVRSCAYGRCGDGSGWGNTTNTPAPRGRRTSADTVPKTVADAVPETAADAARVAAANAVPATAQEPPSPMPPFPADATVAWDGVPPPPPYSTLSTYHMYTSSE